MRLLLAALLTLAAPSHASACRTLVVTKAKVGYAHDTTIQAAVSEMTPDLETLLAGRDGRPR